MKKALIIFGSCLIVLSVAGFQGSQDPLRQKVEAKILPAHITAVSQNFDHPGVLYLIVDGMNFPPKHGANGIARYIRLAPTSRRGVVRGTIYYTGSLGNWTPTRVDDFVPMDVVAGRRYRVGLIQCVEPGPSAKELISNEVDYLLLMKLEAVTPNPVPSGTLEIEVATANPLGGQGRRVVKLGGQEATVTQWSSAGKNFKIRIPAVLAVPGVHELVVEEMGEAASNKVQVRLLGPAIR